MAIHDFIPTDSASQLDTPPGTIEQRARGAIVRDAAFRSTQMASVASPLAYIGWAMYNKGRGVNVNSLLRTVTIGTVIAGPAVGVCYAMLKMENLPRVRSELTERQRRIEANVSQRRLDDYTIIGATVGSLFTSAIFLKRARWFWLVPGGAGLGVLGGTITHYVKKEVVEGQPKRFSDGLRATSA